MLLSLQSTRNHFGLVGSIDRVQRQTDVDCRFRTSLGSSDPKADSNSRTVGPIATPFLSTTRSKRGNVSCHSSGEQQRCLVIDDVAQQPKHLAIATGWDNERLVIRLSRGAHANHQG